MTNLVRRVALIEEFIDSPADSDGYANEVGRPRFQRVRFPARDRALRHAEFLGELALIIKARFESEPTDVVADRRHGGESRSSAGYSASAKCHAMSDLPEKAKFSEIGIDTI